MLEVRTSGSFKNTVDFLQKVQKLDVTAVLNKYGASGVSALASATPKDLGIAANAWSYKIEEEDGRYKIEWHNSDVEGGAPVVVLVQYGHATRNGGYVEGRDFINPAIRPVFDQLANDLWKEVTR